MILECQCRRSIDGCLHLLVHSEQFLMAYLRQIIWLAVILCPSISVANPNVWNLVIGESDLKNVEPEYQIIKTAVISNVRKSVYELALDQLDPEEFFSKNKLRSATLLFNETSILSDIHVIYEDWDFPDALDALDGHFEKNSEPNPFYGDKSVTYSWPDYSVTCFTDAESGFTHVIFSMSKVD